MKPQTKTNIAIFAISIFGGAGQLYLACRNTGGFAWGRGGAIVSCSAVDTPLKILAALAISSAPVWIIVVGVMAFVKHMQK